jgi:hypothetical protein
MKNKGLIIIAILLFIAWKKKKGNIIDVQNTQTTHSTDADYLVQIRKGATFFSANKTHAMGVADNIIKIDGFNTGELPSWLKVRLGNVFYYVKSGDFTIL